MQAPREWGRELCCYQLAVVLDRRDQPGPSSPPAHASLLAVPACRHDKGAGAVNSTKDLTAMVEDQRSLLRSQELPSEGGVKVGGRGRAGLMQVALRPSDPWHCWQ